MSNFEGANVIISVQKAIQGKELTLNANTSKILEHQLREIQENLQHSRAGAYPMTKTNSFDIDTLQNELHFEEEVNSYGINVPDVFHNASSAILYEQALMHEPNSFISNTGALCCSSGAKTGRSPSDKRIVEEATSKDYIWWDSVNIPLSEKSYDINRERAVDYLNTLPRLFVVDAFAGWDKNYSIRVRVITSRAYHALFMQNMLIMPTAEEMVCFKPDFVIYNAGCFPANRYTHGVNTQTSVSINFGRGEMVILGTQYAGEMKKGILTLIMYLMPHQKHLPLHSACNVSKNGEVSLFFGLSGTGKTTLSADPERNLVGDDEHVWTDKGVFNVEGGCYAKCKDLSKAQEPEIFEAIKFGAVLENIVLDQFTREVDYTDCSITQNTRCAYPLEYIPNAHIPAVVDSHPSNIILLTCDAFGVLPPVSKLTSAQVYYHFLSGYTSKVSGTEQGVVEPVATFSACYGGPFLAWHPCIYASMLHEKLQKHKTNAWLISTGWIKGPYGSEEGKRISLKHTRAIINSIHNGTLEKANFECMPIFNLAVPKAIEDVDSNILLPSRAWTDQSAYEKSVKKLADLFQKNFQKYPKVPAEILEAGPKI